jgi:trigger factor
MKSDLIDVSDTRKNLKVEIPSDVVDAEIDRVARDYGKKARIPGFRPGKAPARVIKQRFKEQILHDVAHDLIPTAIDEAMRERGVEPVDTPDVRDVNVDEGQALTFTASFDTLPSFEPGDYSALALRRPSTAIQESVVDQSMQRLREKAARYDPVEGRGIVEGDTAVLDLERHEGSTETAIAERGEGVPAKRVPGAGAPGVNRPGGGAPGVNRDISIELGSKANPPGFDEQLLGLEPGATKTFSIHYPADYPIGELAGHDISYTVTIKALKRRRLPELDDELAKDLGLDTLDALRARVREDLEHEARHAAERDVRSQLLKQLGARLPFEVPESLIERELDRRVEDFARQLMEQNIDPRKAGVDWNELRESQRTSALEGVAGMIVLEEVARRERLSPTEEDVEQEIGRYAERSGRTPAAVRAALEKEGGLSRVYAGLRREKSIDFLMSRATIASD